MSNSLDPDKARHTVGPDLGPNCLKRLSADDKIHRQQAKKLSHITLIFLLVLKSGVCFLHPLHIFKCSSEFVLSRKKTL